MSSVFSQVSFPVSSVFSLLIPISILFLFNFRFPVSWFPILLFSILPFFFRSLFNCFLFFLFSFVLLILLFSVRPLFFCSLLYRFLFFLFFSIRLLSVLLFCSLFHRFLFFPFLLFSISYSYCFDLFSPILCCAGEMTARMAWSDDLMAKSIINF